MFQPKIIFSIGLLAILNITNNINKVQCAFLPSFNDNFEQQQQLNDERPIITWPDNFEISVSTNEFGLNITEKVYFDKSSQKLRMQLFYSIMGLDASRGFDLVLDEQNQTVAVQSDEECKKTDFSQSLLPINLFFNMFNQLTDYEGINDQGLHVYKIKEFNEKIDVVQFYFYFDKDLKYVKSSISQSSFGDLYVDVVQPLNVREFGAEDWYMSECQQIENAILKSGNGWASFMHQLVSHLFLKGEDIQNFLGINDLIYGNKKSSEDDSDEDFA